MVRQADLIAEDMPAAAKHVRHGKLPVMGEQDAAGAPSAAEGVEATDDAATIVADVVAAHEATAKGAAEADTRDTQPAADRRDAGVVVADEARIVHASALSRAVDSAVADPATWGKVAAGPDATDGVLRDVMVWPGEATEHDAAGERDVATTAGVRDAAATAEVDLGKVEDARGAAEDGRRDGCMRHEECPADRGRSHIPSAGPSAAVQPGSGDRDRRDVALDAALLVVVEVPENIEVDEAGNVAEDAADVQAGGLADRDGVETSAGSVDRD